MPNDEPHTCASYWRDEAPVVMEGELVGVQHSTGEDLVCEAHRKVQFPDVTDEQVAGTGWTLPELERIGCTITLVEREGCDHTVLYNFGELLFANEPD